MPDPEATPVTGTRYDRDDARPGEIAFTRTSAAQYVREHDPLTVVNEAPALAVRMDVPFLVMTHEGAMHGNAGDYLMARGPDDAWPLRADLYEANYRQA